MQKILGHLKFYYSIPFNYVLSSSLTFIIFFFPHLIYTLRASLIAQLVKNLPAMQEILV